MDKAAMLAYCAVRAKSGDWIGCECCFTIVYDVMVVCTSIYRRGLSSDSKAFIHPSSNTSAELTLPLLTERAAEAPIVRRMFTSSPKDPRYHMLSHISAKFTLPAKDQQNEPRAALFLNRFTRTLSIMYATSGIQDIIGIPADQMGGRSFYYCIAENCLPDAIKCLEQAKQNDSIAYLRFWFRDPRQDDPPPPPDDDSDEEMTTDASIDDEEGGIHLQSDSGTSASSVAAQANEQMEIDATDSMQEPKSRGSSNDSTATPDTHEVIFGEGRPGQSSASSVGDSPEAPRPEPIELEAVISCTSDGLVVCLRKARPMIPPPTQPPSRPVYRHGLAAAPWAPEPFLPPHEARPAAGFTPAFAPALGPHGAQQHINTPAHASSYHADSDFMNCIRESAVFAWALAGINGTITEFGQGKPLGESLPADVSSDSIL
jgi:hypothetical protein